MIRGRSATGCLRDLWAIDGQESFIEGAQRWQGQALIGLVFTLAAAPHIGWSAVPLVGVAMTAAAEPTQRERIVLAATWATAFLDTVLGENDILDRVYSVLEREGYGSSSAVLVAVGALLLFVVAAGGSLSWVRRKPQSFLARRPVVSLLILDALLCVLATMCPVHAMLRVILWSGAFVLTPYIWFLAYAIVDLRSRSPNSLLFNLAVLHPFWVWSPSYLPYGKGAAYLRRHLSNNAPELAVTQLKAVKLLLWVNVLSGIQAFLSWMFQSSMGVPTVAQALDAFLHGVPYSRVAGWAALVLSTANFSLRTAIWAGIFIGIARLAGYRLPRGSWRPLGSRTLMDYFNRFQYYFKELLVDFFFVPTFLKVFRNYPRLRMFFATFMAAGVGNAIWHFVRDIDLVATHGLIPAFETYVSYAFYCVVLATGVGLSQVRASRGIRPVPTLLGRVRSFLFVWSFVVCMHLFSDGSRDHSLIERLSFLANLLGVSR